MSQGFRRLAVFTLAAACGLATFGCEESSPRGSAAKKPDAAKKDGKKKISDDDKPKLEEQYGFSAGLTP